MTDEDRIGDEATLALANDLIRERLEAQRTAIERIETKATLLLGFAAVGVQLLVTTDARGAWVVVALLAFSGVFVAGIAAIALYEHRFPPDPGRLVASYLHLPRAHVLDVVVRTRAEAFYRNTAHLRSKRRVGSLPLGCWRSQSRCQPWRSGGTANRGEPKR